MTRRETITEKAERYLHEKRLTIVAVTSDIVAARCRGQGDAVYVLGWQPGYGWHCSCPARKYICCHISALQTVVPAPIGRVA